jgi:hypothetical protein
VRATRVRTAGFLVAAGVLLTLVLSACGASRPTPAARSTTTTGGSSPTVQGGPSSRPVHVTSGGGLVGVACWGVGSCQALGNTGRAFALANGRWSGPTNLGTAGPPPSGTSLSCPTSTFCLALPSTAQSATFNGSTWAPPQTVAGAQGVEAATCATPTFCVAIDGEGNGFVNEGSGWGGSAGAWGSANAVSCATPTFCVAAEGGPAMWDGSSWSQPQGLDPKGTLDGVSCPSPAFCLMVDTAGDALAWNGQAWTPPVAVSGAGAGLSAVSCPTPGACLAVGPSGHAFHLLNGRWSSGGVVDPGGHLTAVSCATPTWCTAVDAQGRAVTISG